MTKLQALSEAIEEANSILKTVLDDDEVKLTLEWITVLEELKVDITQFLDKEITEVELYKRLEK
jgi:hypothetical protein